MVELVEVKKIPNSNSWIKSSTIHKILIIFGDEEANTLSLMSFQVKNEFFGFIIFINFDHSILMSCYQKPMSSTDLEIVNLILSFGDLWVDKIGVNLFISTGWKCVDIGLGVIPADKGIQWFQILNLINPLRSIQNYWRFTGELKMDIT